MIAPRAGALATALVATTIALAAQGSLVRFAYAGNWTALYHSGETYGTSPDLAHEDIHLFAGSYGYDGQIYHVIAHDPLMTTGVSPTIDAPRLRYRRILIPLLAWTLAGGRSAYVDIAYRAVVLASVFLGAFCCAWIAADRGRAPAWGALFLLLPATIVSLERMTVDVGLAALAAAWALAATRNSRRQWLALVLAPLVRETGVLLIVAAAMVALLRRRTVDAAFAAATALPAMAWFAFVHVRTPPADYPNSLVPLSGIVRALLHPAPYAAGAPGATGLHGAWRAIAPTAMQVMDGLALVGIVLAFVLAARWLRSEPRSPTAWAAALFALLGVFVQRPDNWAHVYDFGRVYTPLLMLLAFDQGLPRRQWVFLLPWAAILPRVLFQLTGPAMAMFRGVLG